MQTSPAFHEPAAVSEVIETVVEDETKTKDIARSVVESVEAAEEARAATANLEPSVASTTVQVPASALEPLTCVPGVIGNLTEWIVKSARRPNRMLALGAAITIVGTLIGRSVAGPTRSASHLYVVGLAGTGAGKQHAMDCIKAALKQAGGGELIGPGDFTSSRALINFVKRCQQALCAMDEFGAFLRRIGDPKAGAYAADISRELRGLWGISWGQYDSAETAREKSESIQCPALSIYGVSTPEDFYGALKVQEIGNGFLNRFVIIETGKRGPEQEPSISSGDLPFSMIKDLQKLRTPAQHNAGSGAQVKPRTQLQWGPGAKQIYDELSAQVDQIADEQRHQLWSRVPEIAVRLATIRAAARFRRRWTARTWSGAGSWQRCRPTRSARA